MRKRLANGLAIKAIRDAQGIPGGAFATRCIISHAYLSNIEAGRKQPTSEVLHRIADQLGYSIDAISFVTFECKHAHEDVAA